IALHDVLGFLGLGRLARLLRVVGQIGHFRFGDNGPITLRCEVGHDAHRSHTHLLHDFAQLQELLDHRTRLTGLAVHDVANEEHADLPGGWMRCGTFFSMAGQAGRERRARTCAMALGALLAIAISQARGTAQAPPKPEYVSASERLEAIRRGHVWTPTNVAAMDIRTGPPGPGAFAPGALVSCDYILEKSSGKSPKFSCLIPPDDKVRVKFGTTNGEVFAEVAASRLFWALGFGAERNYPVRVECRGCPASIVGADFGP